MITLSNSSKEKYTAHIVFGVVSLSIVLLLVYIDESRYSSQGLFALENLPPRVFYFAIFAVPPGMMRDHLRL